MDDGKLPIICDLYEDSIFLVDEFQLANNSQYLKDRIGHLSSYQWVVMMLPTSGSAEIEIGGELYTCSLGQIMVLLLSDGFVLRQVSDDFSAKTIGMSFNFLRGLNINDVLGGRLAISRQPLIDINREVYMSMHSIFTQLRNLIALKDNPYRFHALQLIVEAYYYTVGYYLHGNADTIRKTGSEVVCDQFIRLVERDFMRHRDLDYYANALCITKKYLSAVVKRVTGVPASKVVSRYVVMWAKQRLIHSNMTVAQISDALGFPNQSFFGRYFHRVVGLSPDAFRKAK